MPSGAEIIQKGLAIWGGLNTTPYSQGANKNGYRTDCSGFVSAALGIAGPGLSTIELPGVCTPISYEQAQPGDIVGKLGPGSGGDAGHVQLLESKNGNSYTVLEQAGGGSGPQRNTYQWPNNQGYSWYHFTGSTGGPAGASTGGSGGESSGPLSFLDPLKIFSDPKFMARFIYIIGGVVLILVAMWKLDVKPVKEAGQAAQGALRSASRAVSSPSGGN